MSYSLDHLLESEDNIENDNQKEYTFDYTMVFKNAMEDLIFNLYKFDFTKYVLIKGSGNSDSQKQPFWSDLDLSVIISEVNSDSLNKLSETYNKFKEDHPEVKLSLTVLDSVDNYSINPLHHHGIKPISYNFELASQTSVPGFSDICFLPNEDAIRLSSIYRYYEILYDLRKNAVNNSLSDEEYVSRGFHRIARFIRTQIEIIDPSLVYKEKMIDEEKFFRKFNMDSVVNDFFEKKRYIKNNWQNIMRDSEQLARYKSYLIDKAESLHRSFMPSLHEIAKKYAK